MKLIVAGTICSRSGLELKVGTSLQVDYQITENVEKLETEKSAGRKL